MKGHPREGAEALLSAFMDWSTKGKIGTLHSGTVSQALW